jgi:hypothetical protein
MSLGGLVDAIGAGFRARLGIGICGVSGGSRRLGRLPWLGRWRTIWRLALSAGGRSHRGRRSLRCFVLGGGPRNRPFRRRDLFGGCRFGLGWRGSLVDRRREGRGRLGGWIPKLRETRQAEAWWTNREREWRREAGVEARRRGVVWRLAVVCGSRAFRIEWRLRLSRVVNRVVFLGRPTAGLLRFERRGWRLAVRSRGERIARRRRGERRQGPRRAEESVGVGVSSVEAHVEDCCW